MNPVLKIVTPNGVPFNVLLKQDGGKYGDVVEFYDARYPQFGELGKYVSSCYTSSILDSKEEYGANLVSHIDDWLLMVKIWLKFVNGQKK